MLLDWKRRVFELYADVRRDPDHEAAWRHWRATRDELFALHPASPLTADQQATFTAVPYFDYDPHLRVLATVEPADRETRAIATSGEEPYTFTRFGRARFELAGAERTLDLYW